MDVYVSAVAREAARSRTDSHADGSTLVPGKAAITGFAANPTRTFFTDTFKANRNHRVTFTCCPFEVMRAISFYAGRISLYAGQISFNAGTHNG